MLSPQPIKNTLTADTSAQKNFSWPRPKGCRASGPGRPRTSPTLSSTWFATSATEWIISANSVGEPVTAQPKALPRRSRCWSQWKSKPRTTSRRATDASNASHLNVTCICHAVSFSVVFAAHVRLIRVSLTYLPAAQDNPFPAGEPFEPDRAARVKLVGRDADLGAESVFESVGKAGRRIDHHRARIDLAHEPHRVAIVLGDDGVGVLRAVASDVLDRGIERRDDTHGKDRPEILGAPIFFGRRFHRRHDPPGTGVAAKLDTFCRVDLCQRGKNARGDPLVNEQR